VGLFCLWLTDRTSCLKSRDVRFESSNTNGVGLLVVGHNDQNDQNDTWYRTDTVLDSYVRLFQARHVR
jgi:hypothetical protein